MYGHVIAFSKIENGTNRRILDTLKALQERRRKIKIERIAVVKARKNQSIRNTFDRGKIEKPTNLVYPAEMKVGGSAGLHDLGFHFQVSIDDDTQVASCCGRPDERRSNLKRG